MTYIFGKVYMYIKNFPGQFQGLDWVGEFLYFSCLLVFYLSYDPFVFHILLFYHEHNQFLLGYHLDQHYD